MGQKELCFIFSADKVGVINWYVDASYAIHDDCRGCIGVMMTFLGGAMTIFHIKNKCKELYSG